MATIENNFREKKGIRLKHKKLFVDLTPMVDLGFLLITFFILSTTLSTPSSTDLVMPKDSLVPTLLKQSAVLTLRPERNNVIDYFEGENVGNEMIKHCSYAEVRSVIQQKQRKVELVLGNKNQTVIIIDPGIESSYKNFVDLLDEIQINDIQHYFVMNRSSL